MLKLLSIGLILRLARGSSQPTTLECRPRDYALVFGATSFEVQEVVHAAVENTQLTIAGKAVPVSSRRLGAAD